MSVHAPSRSLLSAAALAVAACGSRAPADHPPERAPEGAFASPVRAVVEPLFEQEVLFNGMVIALVDGAQVDYLSFGRIGATEAAPGPDGVFEIGSISKVLTSLLLADAVQQGTVALDTPVAQLLPFGVRFPELDGVRPTLLHLASHHAGLPPLPANLRPTDLSNPYLGYGADQLYAYLEDAALMYPPGTAYAYSNLGAGVLGHVLALAAGTSYEAAVTARVLAPMKLANTWITIPADAQARVVPGTTASGTPTGGWDFDVLAGAGAWRSTPRDMVALVQAAAAAAAGKDAPLAGVLREAIKPRADASGGMQIGLAWHVTDKGIVWHNGMTGGYASFIGFDPASGRGVVILGASATPLVTRLGIGIFDVFAGAALDLDLRIVELPAADLDRLVGDYRLEDGQRLRVTRAGVALQLGMGDEQVRLYPRSSTEFLVLELEASVEFVIEDDQVLGFVLNLADGQVPAQRVPDDAPPAGGATGGAR